MDKSGNLLSGNHAIIRGFLKAGVSYMSAYPITPASDLMTYYLKETDGKDNYVFLQAEDEIAAVHSAIGGALAGRMAFTATSGPGFSLKQEGIGLAYAYKVPMVVVDVQRQGPSTGMPTMFSQDTVLQTQYGTHGDHIAITFYPSRVQECFEYAIRSVNAAVKSSSPVVLLSDAYLARLYEYMDISSVDVTVEESKFKPVGTGTRHFTGLTNINGLPRTKDPSAYKEWIANIQQPILNTAEEYMDSYKYINNGNNILIIAYGFLGRVAEDFADRYDIFRPILLFPLVRKLEEIASNYEKIVVIEGNLGQYATIVESKIKRSVYKIPVIGGEIHVNEIKNKLEKIANGQPV